MVRLILISELHSQVYNVYITILMGIPIFQWDTLLNLTGCKNVGCKNSRGSRDSNPRDIQVFVRLLFGAMQPSHQVW